MDPFASIPVFLAVTRGIKRKIRPASYAVGTAAIVLFAFLFFGQGILLAFGITFPSLKIAGGIVLAILGIELVLGLSLARAIYKKYSPAVTLIGTPLLTGPGVIVTTMIFVREYGYGTTLIAAIISLTLSWLILLCSEYLTKVLGEYGVETTSRITGLLLAAVAVEFIISGAKAAFGI